MLFSIGRVHVWSFLWNLYTHLMHPYFCIFVSEKFNTCETLDIYENFVDTPDYWSLQGFKRALCCWNQLKVLLRSAGLWFKHLSTRISLIRFLIMIIIKSRDLSFRSLLPSPSYLQMILWKEDDFFLAKETVEWQHFQNYLQNSWNSLFAHTALTIKHCFNNQTLFLRLNTDLTITHWFNNEMISNMYKM